MRILLSIKAVLNYLYNHLIDLVWTKKIKFQDGTEMTTVPEGNSLYDIKILSQAIADKGFAFMCHTNTRALLKSDVPTLYNDILNKYNNAESDFTPLANGIRLDGNDTCVGVFYNSKLNRYIIINDSIVGYTEYLNSNPTSIGLSSVGYSNNQNSFCANNILLACSNDNKIYKVNLEDWSYKEILSCSNTDYMRSYILKDNDIYVQTNKNVYRIKDDYDDDTVITLDNNSNIIDIIYSSYYDTFIVAKNDGKIYKTNDFSNYDLLTTFSSFKKLFCYNNKIFYIYDQAENIRVYYSEDLFQTQNHTDFPYLSRLNLWYIISNKAYFYSWYGTTHYIFDMNTCSYSVNTIIVDPVKYANYIDNVSANIIVDSYGNTIHYSNYQKILYTDTYKINGNTITVDYYKYNDFKICLSDNGGTNDTNIKTIYDYLGYCNYWLLDLTNETITIQRNKQPFALMYVGDSFDDDLEDLPTISTRALPQQEEIIDSSASVSLDILPNKDYNLINANLTSLTLNSCQDSPLGTTIQFNSGSTPTTITDNTNIDWVDGATPIPSANKTCLIFIWKNKGFYLEK